MPGSVRGDGGGEKESGGEPGERSSAAGMGFPNHTVCYWICFAVPCLKLLSMIKVQRYLYYFGYL